MSSASPHPPRLDPLCVAIVDDDEAARERLSAMIGGTPGFSCVGQHASVEEALQSPRERSVDLFLVDIDVLGLSGAEGVHAIRARFPSAEILILTGYTEDDRVFESERRGAAGHVLKETPAARLLEAIEDAAMRRAPGTSRPT